MILFSCCSVFKNRKPRMRRKSIPAYLALQAEGRSRLQRPLQTPNSSGHQRASATTTLVCAAAVSVPLVRGQKLRGRQAAVTVAFPNPACTALERGYGIQGKAPWEQGLEQTSLFVPQCKENRLHDFSPKMLS